MDCRILVVDDALFFRTLLRLRLEDEEGFSVVAEACDGREAVELARVHQPDVVIIDTAMPLMDGVTALPLLKEASPESRIVLMSTEHEKAMEALRKGADAVVDKSESLSVCIDEITVNQTEISVDDRVSSAV